MILRIAKLGDVRQVQPDLLRAPVLVNWQDLLKQDKGKNSVQDLLIKNQIQRPRLCGIFAQKSFVIVLLVLMIKWMSGERKELLKSNGKRLTIRMSKKRENIQPTLRDARKKGLACHKQSVYAQRSAS